MRSQYDIGVDSEQSVLKISGDSTRTTLKDLMAAGMAAVPIKLPSSSSSEGSDAPEQQQQQLQPREGFQLQRQQQQQPTREHDVPQDVTAAEGVSTAVASAVAGEQTSAAAAASDLLQQRQQPQQQLQQKALRETQKRCNFYAWTSCV